MLALLDVHRVPLPPPSAPPLWRRAVGWAEWKRQLQSSVWCLFGSCSGKEREGPPTRPPPFQSCSPFESAGQHPATCLPGMGVPCPPLLMLSCLALALTAMASPSPVSPSPHPVRASLLPSCRWTLPSHPQKPRWTHSSQSSWATSWRRPGSSWRATARGRGAP